MHADVRQRSIEFLVTTFLVVGTAFAACHAVDMVAGSWFDQELSSTLWLPRVLAAIQLKAGLTVILFGLFWLAPIALLKGDFYRDVKRQRAEQLSKSALVLRLWNRGSLPGVTVDHAPLLRPPRSSLTSA